MNAFTLKLIALISMMIDHIGDVMVTQRSAYLTMRSIGRLSFPIYCFFIGEGYRYTRNIYKYLARIGIFAVISEIPFDLCFSGRLVDTTHQNVMVSFFLAVIMLIVIDHIPELPLKLVTIGVFGTLGQQIHCDYRYIGPLMIFFFVYYRDIPVLKNFTEIMCNIKFSSVLQNMGIMALIPLSFYNGRRGPSLKYLFYAAYPVHLFIIYLAAVYRGIYEPLSF